jgi:hypothetical protein
MPRVAGIYSRPTGIDAVPNNTIDSGKYNSNVADVEADLNLPRPVIAGGTGATSARDALINLSGETAEQVVTNYDTFPFLSGSFLSNVGATGAPNAIHHFLGICYRYGALDMVLEARDLEGGTPPPVYVREKQGGVWGSWSVEGSSLYVAKAGDTMSGALTVNAAIYLSGANNYAVSDGSNYIVRTNGSFLVQNTAGSVSYAGLSSTGLTVGGAILDGPTGSTRLWNAGAPIIQAGSGTTLYDNTIHTFRSLGGSATYGSWNSTNLAVNNTTASSSPTTGALTVAGGVGIGGTIVVGAPAPSANSSIKVGFSAPTQNGISFRPASDGAYPCAFYNNADAVVGSINTTGTTTAFLTSSDGRLKEDLKRARTASD